MLARRYSVLPSVAAREEADVLLRHLAILREGGALTGEESDGE